MTSCANTSSSGHSLGSASESGRVSAADELTHDRQQGAEVASLLADGATKAIVVDEIFREFLAARLDKIGAERQRGRELKEQLPTSQNPDDDDSKESKSSHISTSIRSTKANRRKIRNKRQG